MQNMVRLVYAGEILEGHAEATVQQALADWLKLDDTRRAALSSGRRLVIKKALEADQAHKWVAQFKARGARLLVEPLPPEMAAPPAAAAQPLPTIAPPAVPSAPTPAPFTLELAPLAPPVGPAPPPWAAPRADASAPLPLSLLGPDPAAVPPPIKTIAPPSDEMMDCPACGERQTKRILCKACACDMPRGIAAKEEAAAAARAEREAEAQARRDARAPRMAKATAKRRAATASRLRGEEETPYFGGDDAPLFGLSFEGRMPRMRYFFSGLLFWVGLVALALPMALLPGMSSVVMGIVGFAVMVVWTLRVTVLRLHDIGRNGWWALTLLVPYLNLIASLIILLLPSEEYENEHGPKPVDEGGQRVVIVLGTMLLVFLVLMRMGWSAFQRELHRMQDEDDDGRPEAQERSDDPMPTSAELLSALHSQRAVNRFREDYWHAGGHRAFSVSNDGASGWYATAPSIDTAVREALASCDHDRRPYTSECYIVHVDTDWAMR